MSQQATLDWLVDSKNQRVQHKTGLVIQLSSNKNEPRKKPAALDILWLDKLAGTPWATRSNLLIEAGISLLRAL